MNELENDVELREYSLHKHIRQCPICSSGKTCYRMLQASKERSVGINKFSYTVYPCYLLFVPLYIAGHIISFNAFASQLDTPQKSYTLKQVIWYGFRWVLSLFLMEIMTHFFYYNAFAISGIWKQLSPVEVIIVGYGVRAHVAGAITITFLMVANLVGFVVGPSGVSWLKSVFLHAEVEVAKWMGWIGLVVGLEWVWVRMGLGQDG
ncbi:hypothetical protein Hanom_Chr06g00576051 [Helianthus anomalus]